MTGWSQNRTNVVDLVLEDTVTLFNLPVVTLSGVTTTLGELAGGKPTLIVNVASKCGLTPQYAALELLHAAGEVTVIGVPCNQFMGQEPGTAEEIAQFCSATYGVSFPMLAKTDVNGADRSPLFELLTSAPDAEGTAGDVTWNFEKWLLGSDGAVQARFRPMTVPDDAVVLAAIEQAVKEQAAA